MFRGPPPCSDALPAPQPDAVLRPTLWGHCHWVWRAETIGDAVRDTGSFGPVEEVRAALRYLGPSSHLVDVGTNVGLVSAAALAIGHNVTCFEAERHNADLLRATLALNNWTARATVVDRAVVANSYKTRQVAFRRWDAGNRGGSRIVKSTAVGSTLVPTTQLDLWASQLPSSVPVVMKIDIEGCEHGALRGAKRKLLPRVDVVISEISPRAMVACGGNASGYARLLQRHGFTEVSVSGHRHGGFPELFAAIQHAESEKCRKTCSMLDATFWRPRKTMVARLSHRIWQWQSGR